MFGDTVQDKLGILAGAVTAVASFPGTVAACGTAAAAAAAWRLAFLAFFSASALLSLSDCATVFFLNDKVG